MSGITVKIGADISGFEKGQRDAVSSARRGAQEMATAYVASSAVAKATMQSVAINVSAMQIASGNAAATMSGVLKAGAMDGFAEIGRGASTSSVQISSLDEKLRSLPAPIAQVVEGFAVFQAVTTVWQAFNQALEDTEVRMARLNAIGAAARQLGTGPTFLTSLIAQAKQLGVETETLTGMLVKAREASRVQIGEGKDGVNESAFQSRLRQNVMAGNLSREDVAPYNAARTQEEQIRAVLDLLEKLKAANRDVAANDLGRTFFGADFEARTRQGIDLIGAFRAALDGAKINGGGLAPTPEEIARTQEMAAREEAIAATIRDAIAPAVHDFNALSDAGKQTWIEWEERVAGWVKWLGEGYLKIKDVAAQVRQMAADWGLIAQPPHQEEGGPLPLRIRPPAKGKDRSNPLPSLSTARAPKDPQDQDSVINVIRQLEKTRDLAEAELRTVGLSNREKERAVDLAKAEAAARSDVEKGNRENAALTAEETRRILEAADATAQFRDRQKDLEQQLRANAETARYFGDALANSLGDAVLEGKSLQDVLTSLGKMLSRGVLQAVFTGQGPLASLLGLAPAASSGPNAVGGLFGSLTSAFGGGGGANVGLDFMPHSYATGVTSLGMIEGPGTGTSDSILAAGPRGPIRVSNGESIVTARATQRYRPFIEAMNSGRLPGYASGVVNAGYDALAGAGATMMAQASAAAQGAKTEPAAFNMVVNNTQSDKVEAVPRRQPDGSMALDIIEKGIAGRISARRSPIASALNAPRAG